MSNWINHLDLRDIYQKFNKDNFTDEDFKEAGKLIAEEIVKMNCYKREIVTLGRIVSNLKRVKTANELDKVMNRLYDWGDTPLDNIFGGKKICWIATIF